MRIIILSISIKGMIIAQNDKDEESEEEKYLLTESDHDSSKNGNSKLFELSAIFWINWKAVLSSYDSLSPISIKNS